MNRVIALTVLGVVLVCSASAKAQTPDETAPPSGPAIHIVTGAFIAMAVADIATSTYQIDRNVARERGFGAAWQDSPAAFTASKIAVTGVFAYCLQRMHKTRPKTAIALGVAATAVEAMLAGRSATIAGPAPGR